MIFSKEILGLDTRLRPAIIGCDPGPKFCALACVARDGNKLVLDWVDYVSVEYVFYATRNSVKLVATPDFTFVYEKMTARYGAIPGETVFDTCRNSGVIAAAMARQEACKRVCAVSTTDWRVALGGLAKLTDAEVRRAIIDLFGSEGDAMVARRARELKKAFMFDKPVSCHLRDAIGVAAGAYLMPVKGVSVVSRTVWSEDYAK